MLVVYTTLVFLLGAARLLVQRKAAALAKKYSQLALQTEKLLRDSAMKEGNSSRSDPYQTAKKHYLLGCLVEKKERLEAKHFAWQVRAERFTAFVTKVYGYRGKAVPYVLGAADTVLVLAALEACGLRDQAGLPQLAQWLSGWIHG